MRFLRMLTNALLAGALGAAYLTVLVLQLNPHVPLLSSTVGWWYITLGALYGVHLAVLFYVAMVLRQFVTLDMFSPGWVSVRLLAWLSSITAAAAAALMWLNVRGLPAVLDEAANRHFVVGAGATTASAVVLLGIAIAHYSFGRRGSRVGASHAHCDLSRRPGRSDAVAHGPRLDAIDGACRMPRDPPRIGVGSSHRCVDP